MQDVSPADHKATIHHLSMAAHYYYSENRCYRCWSEYILTHFLNLLVSYFFSLHVFTFSVAQDSSKEQVSAGNGSAAWASK